MATKQVILSDISGAELTDDTHAKVIVKHPDMNFAVEIDMSTEEAAKLQTTALRLIEFTIHEPNKAPRTAVMETKVADKVFSGVDLDGVLQGARKAETQVKASRAPRGSGSKSTGDRLDYTAPENFGKLHRGRVTDEEAGLVRANRDQASANREAQTGSPIDWTDPKEVKRYGL